MSNIPDSIIVVENLSHQYANGTYSLKNISLSCRRGDKIAILGANGSGKSTFLQHLNGLILPQSGQVTIAGVPISKKTLPHIRERVGFVFDHPDDQLFSSSVFEDIAFGPRNLNWPNHRVLEKVQEVLHAFELTPLSERAPYHLSLGQKKKVAIAGVLAMEPDILVFDEPFSGLDAYTVGHLTDLLDDMTANHRTLVIATHDLDLAKSWANQFIIFSEGCVLASGDASLLDNEALMKQAKLKKHWRSL